MRTLANAALVIAALSVASAAHANVLISIDKSTQRMTVSVDGATRWVWPVSTGRRGHATPSGSYQAFRMEEDHYSKEWDDAPMPHSIFFTKRGHAIHGSFETRRLGMPASAGCVRLNPDNARRLFTLVKEQGVLNTTVIVSGEEPRISAPAVAQKSRPAPRTVRNAPQYEADDVAPTIRQRQPRYPSVYYPSSGYHYAPPMLGSDYYYYR